MSKSGNVHGGQVFSSNKLYTPFEILTFNETTTTNDAKKELKWVAYPKMKNTSYKKQTVALI